MATTPVGSGTVKLKYGPATGFEPPSTWGSLSVQPAYQTTRSMAASTSAAPGARGGEVGGARLHHLGQAVQHLPPVVRGRGRPLGERAARRLDGVARILAGGAGDVLALRLERAARLGARERAADEELVRLADGQTAAHSNLRYASSPWRPPSRPKPDSL